MNNIQKSSFDKKEYKYFVLENDIKVLIISDVRLSSNYVSMICNVGYMNDTVPGIAHFL
jgi:insulysin